jgi:hypothetical protein
MPRGSPKRQLLSFIGDPQGKGIVELREGKCKRNRYAKNCPQHGPVASDAIVRGYEYAPDQFVVVEAEELNRLRPVKDRALILEQFLPVQEVAPTFFAGRSLSIRKRKNRANPSNRHDLL